MLPSLLLALSFGGALTLYATVGLLLMLYGLDRIGERLV